MLTGITLISSGENLKYPWKECVSNLCEQCEEVIVNIDIGSQDNTIKLARDLWKKYSNLRLVFSKWDFKNTGNGQELAYQANLANKEATGNWILYLQADEFLLDDHVKEIKDLIIDLDPKEDYTQLELYRTYFYGDLTTRKANDELYLGRVFRRGTHQVGGDGMYLIREKGRVLRTQYPIFHYSRIGKEEDITRRIRQLDIMFHDKEIVDTFDDFYYNETTNLKRYFGSHPKRIKEFYGEK